MKLLAAPISLKAYFLTEMTMTANPEFKQDKPPQLDFSDLKLESAMDPKLENSNERGIWLSVKQSVSPEKNVPYAFALKFWALIEVPGGLTVDIPAQRREFIMHQSAINVLYGAAREVVRGMTSHGPFPAIVLPMIAPTSTSTEEASPTTKDG